MRTTGTLARRLAAVCAALVLGVTASLVPAAPAQAEQGSSPCQWYEMCYWYQSNYGGAQTSVLWGVWDLASPPFYFHGGGAGSGTQLWNNAGSGANYDPDYCVGVYYSQGWGTPALYLAPWGYCCWWSSTLGPVNNNNRSQLVYVC